MRKVAGTLDGTGAAIYVGLGFEPDYVKLWNGESTNPYVCEWNSAMRTAEQVGGYVVDNATPARLTETAGIEKYLGGDTADGTETYLMYYADVLGQGNLARTGETITSSVASWVLDTKASRTGSFDAGVNTTYVGEGSRVRIFDPLTKKTYESVIMVLSNDGDADDEVELAYAIPSGEVDFIGPVHDYIAATSGLIMPAGFKIATTGNLNSDGEMICFEAGTYL